MRILTMSLAILLASASEAATVIVVSNPRGADVVIDDIAVGKTPFRQSLPEGAHQLTLKKAEYQDLVQTVQVGKKLVVLRLELKPKTYPVDILFENMNKQTMDWHVFANDGTHLGTAPGTFNLSKGKVKLLLVKEGFSDIPIVTKVTGDVQVVDLEDPKPGRSSWFKLSTMQFVGNWVKKDSGSCVFFKIDCTFHVDSRTGSTWDGKWKPLNNDSISMDSEHDGQFTLTLQKDGSLTGKEPSGHSWDLHPVTNR